MVPDLSQSPWGPSLQDGDKVFPGWLQNMLLGYGGGAEDEGWLFRTRMWGKHLCWRQWTQEENE